MTFLLDCKTSPILRVLCVCFSKVDGDEPMGDFLNQLTDGYHWVFLILFALLGLCASREKLFSSNPYSNSEDPVNVLKLRFAAGEITEEEYFHKLDLIQPHGPMYS